MPETYSCCGGALSAVTISNVTAKDLGDVEDRRDD